MAGLKDAGHTEIDPDAKTPLLVLASCPVDSRPDGAPRLSGRLKIKILSGSSAARIYQKEEIEEPFTCNYELNPVYRKKLESTGLKVSGETTDGGTRIIELQDRPFFIGTGFVPQLNSAPGRPHPLIVALLQSALQ